jgi:galactokinase
MASANHGSSAGLLSRPARLLEALAAARRPDPALPGLVWSCAAGGAGPVCAGFVPGRIEVLGRHTDYAGGRSLVCAIDRGFSFAARPTDDGMVRLREEDTEFEPVAFPLTPGIAPRAGHWANYPMTMARRLARNFGADRALRGVDIVFSSTMPVGSGMSGSSALMMMAFTAIALVNDLPRNPRFRAAIAGPVDLSMYLACAENGQSFRELDGDRGVGTFGGSEDHAAILGGRAGRLSLFRFCPSVLLAEPAWPRSWRMVVAFSGVRAEKTREAMEKYNLVSRRAREAVAAYNRLNGTGLSTLREVVEHAAAASKGAAGGGASWLRALDASAEAGLDLAGRVRQFIQADGPDMDGALAALKARDIGAFGGAINESHRGSKRGLWNIVPEVDWLASSALRLGAAGASGFGAGFGGSILAVTEAASAERFRERWRASYLRRHPARAAEAAFFIAEPRPGIQAWTADGPSRLVDLLFRRV